MTLGSPSGSGATKDDIADGADRSEGRWLWGYRGPVKEAAETTLTVSGSGAVATFDRYNAQTKSGGSGDYGVVSSGGTGDNVNRINDRRVGAVLIKATVGIKRSISSYGDSVFVGMFEDTLSNDRTASNIAIFDPAVGDNASGNVRVDSNGTDTDGSVTYPTMADVINSYTVLIDIDGVYLSAGHTGFYINSDPRLGDSPDADLAAIPNLGDSRRVFGYGYKSRGAGDRTWTDHLEVGWRP